MPHDVHTQIELEAPIGKVWSLLADINSWDTWTPIFNFKMASLKPGGRALLLAKVGPAPAPLPVKFDVVDKERELRWHGGVKGMLYGSHFLKLEKIDENRTRLIHGEEFSGLVISASWGLLGKQLPAAYKAFNRHLSRRLI